MSTSTVNPARLRELKTTLAATIRAVHAEDPNYYAWPASQMTAVIGKMHAVIDNAQGLRNINIDSRTFQRCAKQLGIKNTYKAWAEWLAGGL